MGGGAGSDDRFFCMAKALVGKALLPEHKCKEDVANSADIIAQPGSLGAIALGIVERETCFEVPARHGEITQLKLELAQPEMHLPKKKPVSDAFGEAECLLGGRQRGAQFSAVHLDGREVVLRQNHLKLRRRIDC